MTESVKIDARIAANRHLVSMITTPVQVVGFILAGEAFLKGDIPRAQVLLSAVGDSSFTKWGLNAAQHIYYAGTDGLMDYVFSAIKAVRRNDHIKVRRPEGFSAPEPEPETDHLKAIFADDEALTLVAASWAAGFVFKQPVLTMAAGTCDVAMVGMRACKRLYTGEWSLHKAWEAGGSWVRYIFNAENDNDTNRRL